MCGIIGYIGSKEVVPVLVDGLRRLEYRGYDSAGIALVQAGQIEVRRSAGKLARLEEVVRTKPVQGDYGIGHTRWATHGRPTEENAHPHRDCTGQIVVVHNGIIENYLDLKHQLQREGHRFETETDTEVVAHLVEREMRDDGLEHAVRRALLQLRGVFGLVLVAANDPDKIVAVRNGPPIVVGMGDGEFVVASDIPAVLEHTRDVVFLDDEEMAIIKRAQVEFTDFAGQAVSKSTQRIQWDPVMAEKAGYKHFMLKEIFEQPWAVQETVLGRISEEKGAVLLEELNIPNEDLRAIEHIVILACGTSWHAGLVGKFMIERLAKIRVDVDYGSEFRYRDPLVSNRTLVIGITQSGETADTLAALRKAKSQGAKSVAICNVVGSMATRETDGTLYTHAGPEIGVASTKAFTSQLVALNLFALYLGCIRGTVLKEEAESQIEALTQLPGLLRHTLQCDATVTAIAKQFYRCPNFLYLGRGVNYPIALEGALKLKEISYIHAEGYPAGEMKHGPIALIDENVPVVVLMPSGAVFDKMMNNLQEARTRGGSLLVVTDADPETFSGIVDLNNVITIPTTHLFLTPILMAIPLQLLAYHIAVLRGCDVDQPRNLAKSVTVE
jgi:glucosamine--fructose-6-phosphate aminotransferase (isomerizing)